MLELVVLATCAAWSFAMLRYLLDLDAERQKQERRKRRTHRLRKELASTNRFCRQQDL